MVMVTIDKEDGPFFEEEKNDFFYPILRCMLTELFMLVHFCIVVNLSIIT